MTSAGSSLADLAAQFFRRTGHLLGRRGALGFIATNSVAQGDSRQVGLGWLAEQGASIYFVERALPWPGEAAVVVCVVHVGRGLELPKPQLDGRGVPRITSFLSARGSEKPPAQLVANRGVSVIGSFVLGIGFVFDDKSAGATSIAEMQAVLHADPRNGDRILRYVGGEDLNTSPSQTSDRYIIDFGDMTEEEARRWPALFKIIEAKVKPARASVKQRDRREEWWRHATRSPVLREHLTRTGRALAVSQVTTHLAFSFVPDKVVLSHTSVALLIASGSGFAVVQSRVHEVWARHLASSLKSDLRYTPTDCFETFPFPRPDPRTVLPELEAVGERVYGTRARFMVNTDQGLTKTYNALKDPGCTDPRVVELRHLHEEMDRAVLAVYGWSDLEVPPYCPTRDSERVVLKAFEDGVIDRLFELNGKRAEEERAQGLGAHSGKEHDRTVTKTSRRRSVGQPNLPGMDGEDG
jgi:hypothetical protein